MKALVHHLQTEHSYKPLSIDKVKALTPGTEALVFSAYHSKGPRILRVKINGKPKTWKTRPNNVTVPIKYGLYEHARIAYTDGAMSDPNLYFVTLTDEA